ITGKAVNQSKARSITTLLSAYHDKPMVLSVSGSHNLHGAAVREALRWVYNDAFSGGDPGADGHFIIETAADSDCAALGAAILHDQNHVASFLLLDSALGQSNRAGSHRAGNPSVAESHFYTHLGQDARVELYEADTDFHGGF